MTITTTRSPRGSVILRRNECTNPSIVGQTGWQNLWFGAGGTGTDSMQGTELDKTWTKTPTSMEDAGWRYHHTGWAGDYVQKTCSAYFYCNGFEPKAAIKARYFNKDGGLIRYDTGPVTQLYISLGWQRVTGTFQCPPGTAWVDVDFVLMPGNNAQPNQGIAFQRALIEPGATAYSYFDGQTYANGNGSQYTTWAGTVNNSQSLLWDADPATQLAPAMVLGYDVGQQSRNIIHQLIDGPVAATLLPASTRQGVLKLFFEDAASAENARAKHATAGTWYYLDTDQPQEAMWYAVNGTVRKYQSDNRKRWILEVPYNEVS
jgi:hypothetical protein